MKIIIALLIFSVIIIIHELGHFLLAKKNGIIVLEFSLGMGPRLFSFDAGGTKYSLKLLPFGGSCMMLGEDGEEEIGDSGQTHADGLLCHGNRAVTDKAVKAKAGNMKNVLR